MWSSQHDLHRLFISKERLHTARIHVSHPHVTLVTCVAGPTGHAHTSHSPHAWLTTPTRHMHCWTHTTGHTHHMHCWTHRSHPHVTLTTRIAGPTGHTHTSHSPHALLDPQVIPTRHTCRMHGWTHRSHPHITLVTCMAGPTGHTHTSHSSHALLDPQVTPTHHIRHMHRWTHRSHPHITLVTCIADPQVTPTRHTRHMHCWTNRSHPHVHHTRHMHCWTHRSHPHTTLVTCIAGPTGHTHTSHSSHALLDPQVTPTHHTRHMHCWTHRSYPHVTLVTWIAGPTGHTHTSHPHITLERSSHALLDQQVTPMSHQLSHACHMPHPQTAVLFYISGKEMLQACHRTTSSSLTSMQQTANHTCSVTHLYDPPARGIYAQALCLPPCILPLLTAGWRGGRSLIDK